MNDDSVGGIIPGSSGQPEALMQDPMDVYTNYIELDNFSLFPCRSGLFQFCGCFNQYLLEL